MEILVAGVGGFGETATLVVDASDTIDDLKAKLQEKAGAPPDNQVLIFNGRKLDEGGSSLADYNIGEGAKLHLVIRDNSAASHMSPSLLMPSE